MPESADVIKNNANTIIDRRLVKPDKGKYSRNAKSSCSGLSVNAPSAPFATVSSI